MRNCYVTGGVLISFLISRSPGISIATAYCKSDEKLLKVKSYQKCKRKSFTTRSFMAQTQGEKVLLKLDVKNAFNSIRRDTVLQAAQTHLPEIYPFIWDCHSCKTSLFHGEFCLDSATGVQQGDPLGPALFVLAIHGVTSEVKLDLSVWYLDDGCIGDDP